MRLSEHEGHSYNHKGFINLLFGSDSRLVIADYLKEMLRAEVNYIFHPELIRERIIHFFEDEFLKEYEKEKNKNWT